MRGVVVAFSGGVDSTMLLHAAVRVLGSQVLAVTADSPSLPRRELAEAEALAQVFGARHRVLQTNELDRPGYERNGSDRCYFCKAELFETTATQLQGMGEADWTVVYGAIVDDLGDHRPGQKAAAERGIQAPLADAGFTKNDVREYSRRHDLTTADKPSFACLASRVAYGTPIDAALLQRLESAEELLASTGVRTLRVRHHEAIARIEVTPKDLPLVLEHRERLVAGMKDLGWSYVTLDLAGFRSGSMNDLLQDTP